MNLLESLPDSWSAAPLEQLANLINGDRGEAYPSKGSFVSDGVPFINAGHLDDGLILMKGMNFISLASFHALRSGKVRTNDILFCLRGSLGKVGLVVGIEQGAIASSLVIVRTLNEIEPRFVLQFLRGPLAKEEIDRYNNGSAQPNLSSKSLGSFVVPLPPVGEQKRIADKLDTVLTRVDAINTRMARVVPLLKRFRQSVLAAATSGRLTEDWRKVTSNVVGEFKQLGSMGSVIAGQSPSVSEVNRDGHGMPYVTGPEQWDGKKILAHKWTEYPKRVAPENSIFITVKGAGVGKTFPGCHAAIGRDIYAFFPSSEHLHKYVLFAIQASAEMVVLKAKGLIPGLTKADIAEQIVYVPSRDEQLEIVRRVEILFAFADRLEARLQTAQTAADRLTPSLLAKAFRGELVPQDPNDEPASELLKRLAASAPASASKRGRAKSSTAA